MLKDEIQIKEVYRPTLTSGQQAALDQLNAWAASKDDNFEGQYLLLQGEPGTGKTFLLKTFLENYRFKAIATAPTNKATGILKNLLTTDHYRPITCTIYSLLGLQLNASGEVKEIQAPEEDIDLSSISLVIVDEGSMIPQIVLDCLVNSADSFKYKVLFVGDSYQIPEVKKKGERPKEPAVWAFADKQVDCIKISLTEVVRNGGAILEAVREIRKAIDSPFSWKLPFLNRYKALGTETDQDVLVVRPDTFRKMLINEAADDFRFLEDGETKIIAWTNKAVDIYNNTVQEILFPGHEESWIVGGKVVLTSPAKNIEGRIIAPTDTEGIIEKVITNAQLNDYGLTTESVQITTFQNQVLTFTVLAQESEREFKSMQEDRLLEARENPRRWKGYWEFMESVHYLRYSYAITAHRAQGSTYKRVYVDLLNILRNYDKKEALQCLNVACSRASETLIVSK